MQTQNENNRENFLFRRFSLSDKTRTPSKNTSRFAPCLVSFLLKQICQDKLATATLTVMPIFPTGDGSEQSSTHSSIAGLRKRHRLGITTTHE